MGAFSSRQVRTVLAAINASDAVVGVAADRHRLALVLSTGQVWGAALNGKSAAALASVIDQTTKPLWTVEPMHRTARTLVGLGAECAAHRVRNVTAAEAIIVPTPEHRRAGERQVGADRHDAEAAATVAADVAAWVSQQEVGARRLALRGVELDMVWRPRVIVGWPVDFDALEVALERATTERARIYINSGLPLADALSDATDAQAIAWLAGVGLHPQYLGEPSLTKDAIEELAEPEANSEAWRRWELITAATRHLLRAAPGKVLVSVDLAQAEVRIAAALSGDKLLIAALDAGDAYEAMAKTIWGVVEVTAELRARAKTIMISVLYGKGVAATATSLGVGVGEARDLIDQFWNAYPQLDAFNEACKAAAGTQVHTVTLGRPLPITPEAYKMLNRRVQGEGADIITIRAAVVADRLGADALWLSVHDELVVEVTPDRAGEAVQVLAEVITAPFLDAPMRGTPEIIGRSWRK